MPFCFKTSLACTASGETEMAFTSPKGKIGKHKIIPRSGNTETLRDEANKCLGFCSTMGRAKSLQLRIGRKNCKNWVCRCFSKQKTGDKATKRREYSVVARKIECKSEPVEPGRYMFYVENTMVPPCNFPTPTCIH